MSEERKEEQKDINLTYIVEGYAFDSKEEAEKAERELAKVRTLNAKLDEDNLAAIKMVYLSALEQNIFETQIGLSYLRNLQIHLINEGVLKSDEKPLPIQHSKHKMDLEIRRIKEEYREEAKSVREEARKRVEAERELAKQARMKSRSLALAIGVLCALVIGMFIITFTGDNPNIINYKNALENQYSEWEQELDEREAVIREKEAELNIQP